MEGDWMAPRNERAPWVVVLAGGDGRRLSTLTLGADGRPVPKQFFRFRDERSLLAETLERARGLTIESRIVVVVVEAHRRLWEADVAGLDPHNVLVQPTNRGTGIAILHAWAHVRGEEAQPRLVFMPSDHEVDDPASLVLAIGRALSHVPLYEESLLLLGVTPTRADGEYGFIVPCAGRASTARPVRRFVEKPAPATATDLLREGALWNTFIFACGGRALEGVFRDVFPVLTREYLRRFDLARGDLRRLEEFFRALPRLDFSHDLLEGNARRLRAVTVPACGWTDLGTPHRLAHWLATHLEASYWQYRANHGLDDSGGDYQPARPSG
jgi:mannose-1-phosphate guanylyltransferase